MLYNGNLKMLRRVSMKKYPIYSFSMFYNGELPANDNFPTVEVAETLGDDANEEEFPAGLLSLF